VSALTGDLAMGNPLLAAVDPARVTPGLLGFLVFVGLGVATWLLIRSMNTQLKKIDFDEGAPGTPGNPPPPPRPDGDGSAGGATPPRDGASA